MNQLQKREPKVAFKLFRRRCDGSITSLFIDSTSTIKTGEWLPAKHDLQKKGFAVRPGWHTCAKPVARHLRTTGDRVWYKVEICDYVDLIRPQIQGSVWYLSNWMKVLGPVKTTERKKLIR